MSRMGNENEASFRGHSSDEIPHNIGIQDLTPCAFVHRENGNSNWSKVTGDLDGDKIVGQCRKRKLLESWSSLWAHFNELECPQEYTPKVRCECSEAEFEADPIRAGTNDFTYPCGFCKRIAHGVAPCQMHLNMRKSVLGTANNAEGCVSLWKYDDVRVWRALCTMVIVDGLPFKFVESISFRHLMSVICPQFNLPSRKSLAKGIFQIYRDEKLKLKSFLKESCQKVCIIIDTWTSAQNMRYMCLTIHFIDNDWKQEKKVLNFRPITDRKDAEIVKVVTKCIHWWGIENILTITVGDAYSNEAVVSCLKKRMNVWKTSILSNQYVHINCITRIINQEIRGVLRWRANDEAIVCIREAIRYVLSSPVSYEAFSKCAELETGETNRLLCLDVPNRWDSTYLMLEAATSLQKAFVSFLESDYNFKKDLKKFQYRGVPSNDHWKRAKLLVKFMGHFYDTVLKISGSSYVTSDTVFHEITAVDLLLKEWSESSDSELSQMAVSMKENLDKYWESTEQRNYWGSAEKRNYWESAEKRNKFLYYAVILDPRYKLEFPEYCFDKMYDIVTSEKMKKEVREGFTSLFNEYKRIYDTVECCPNIVSDPSSSSSVAVKPPHLESGGRHKPSMVQEFRKIKSGDMSKHVKSELDKYLAEEVEIENEENDNFNILLWWKVNGPRFPIISKIARDILAVPFSTITSEAAFSTGWRELDAFKSSLLPKTVEALVCAQDWLRESLMPVCVEEDIHEANWLEKELSKLSVRSSMSPPVD